MASIISLCRKCGISNFGVGGVDICRKRSPPEDHDFPLPIVAAGISPFSLNDIISVINSFNAYPLIFSAIASISKFGVYIG